MRLPERLLQRPDWPLDVHKFVMEVPVVGYRWLENAYPSAEWGEENRRQLASGPPYMVVQGLRRPARRYQPLVDTPGLFQKFKELSPDRESLLRFANEYGWIAEKGNVSGDGVRGWPAVGLATWENEIQDMIVADRLFQLASREDNHALRQFFTWHPEHFQVEVAIEVEGGIMRSSKNRKRINPHLKNWRGRLAGGLVPPHIDVRSLGWKRGDFVLPALSIVEYIVNERIWNLCRPILQLSTSGKFTGNWTSVNLLGCIWLQYYLTVIGQLKIRRCAVCGGEMDVSHSRISRRMHTRCSRNKRQAAWRAKLKSSEPE